MHAAPSSQSTLARLGTLCDLFAAPLRASHYLELINPRWSARKLEARVTRAWDETASARTLTLQPGRRWRAHRAGQHVRVGVPIDGRWHTRTYSVASAPERSDGCITITVNALADGRVSRHLVRSVVPGDYLSLDLPEGDFVLPEAGPVRPLFITAGSGITPIMSMLRSYAARGDVPDVAHVHYAPRPRDVIFAKELARLAADHPPYRLTLVYTRTAGGPRAGTRHLTPAHLGAVCPDWRERDAYVCGPQGLLAAAEAQWQAAAAADRLHVERFHAPWSDVPAEGAGGQVRFVRSGRAVASDGRTSLLHTAEDAGLSPPHGCRMGICHRCDVRLLAGSVRDLRSGAVSDEPGGTIQICVNAAAGDVALEL